MCLIFKTNHYSILRDDVYTHNFEIHYSSDQVRLPVNRINMKLLTIATPLVVELADVIMMSSLHRLEPTH